MLQWIATVPQGYLRSVATVPFAGWTGSMLSTVHLPPVHPAIPTFHRINQRQDDIFAKKKNRHIFLINRENNNIKIKKIPLLGPLDVQFFRFSASSLAVILRQFALSPSYAADEQITQGLSPSWWGYKNEWKTYNRCNNLLGKILSLSATCRKQAHCTSLHRSCWRQICPQMNTAIITYMPWSWQWHLIA